MASSFVPFTVALLVLLGPPPQVRAGAHIRPLHERVRQTLDHAYATSPTVRRLVDELGISDVIVHLVPRQQGGGPAGTLRFAGAARGVRYLRVTVDITLPDRHLAALIGHELQHAAEVARARWVVDQCSFADLYRTTGHATDVGAGHFDTAAARRVTRQVFMEMRGTSWWQGGAGRAHD